MPAKPSCRTALSICDEMGSVLSFDEVAKSPGLSQVVMSDRALPNPVISHRSARCDHSHHFTLAQIPMDKIGWGGNCSGLPIALMSSSNWLPIPLSASAASIPDIVPLVIPTPFWIIADQTFSRTFPNPGAKFDANPS